MKSSTLLKTKKNSPPLGHTSKPCAKCSSNCDLVFYSPVGYRLIKGHVVTEFEKRRK